jgi:hypothetical protein
MKTRYLLVGAFFLAGVAGLSAASLTRSAVAAELKEASKPAPAKITVPGAFNVTRVGADVTCAGATDPAAFAQLKQLGYTSIINLRRDGEQGTDISAARRVAEAAGLKYVHVPVETENVTREAVPSWGSRP